MSARKMSTKEMLAGGLALGRYLTVGGLFNINLEVTKRCNARCNFCDYWQEPGLRELGDYVPVIRKLRPLSVSLTGGEPLLRKDLVKLVASIRRSFSFVYLSLITNGRLLTEVNGLELWSAGLDELSISIDYPDQRHDQERGLPGLTSHILRVAPRLASHGVNLCFNTVIKRGNFRDLPDFSRQVHDLGIKQSFSTYNGWRVGNRDHSIPAADLEDLLRILTQLKDLRDALDHIGTRDYYFDRIPRFFHDGEIPGCTAGINWLQVTPDGLIKRCSDAPARCRWTEWTAATFAPTECNKCWYSCRGAAQERLGLKRLIAMTRAALG